MTKYCPNCGEKLIDDAKFCKSCGASLNSSAPRATVPEPPAYERSYTVHIIVAYALALLIPLLGIVMGVYLMTRKDSEQARKHGKYALIVAFLLMAYSLFTVLRYF